MGQRGTPMAELVLSDSERDTLERWARRHKSAPALALRCRIVLACAEGASNTEVAERFGVSRRMTVGKWRARFVVHRLDGLHDEPRPGGPRSIGDDDVERVVVKTLEETPVDATHGSTRSMAKATGMSQSAVSRIWRAFGLKPHLVDEFKLSPDPLFIDKVRDIVGLYLNPPDAAVVLCVDEKTQVQALDRTAPILPLLPGTPERRTHDYKRNGTTNLYAALDVASGQVIVDVAPRHRTEEFRRFLNLINKSVPGRARRSRQPVHPQDPVDPTLAAATSPLHAALHADLLELAQPRRTLVRRTHHQVAHRLRLEARARPDQWPAVAFTFNVVPFLGMPPISWRFLIDEVREYLTNGLRIAGDGALDTVLRVQHALLPTRHRSFPLSLELSHDYVAWHRAMVDAKDSGCSDWEHRVPRHRDLPPAVFTVDDPNDFCSRALGVEIDENLHASWELDSPLARAVSHEHLWDAEAS